MKNIIFALIIPLFITSVSFSSPIDVLLECDPTPTFKDNYYDGSSKDSVLKTYNGQINDEDWAICENEVKKNIARDEKKDYLNEWGLERICITSGLCYATWYEVIIAYHDWQSISPAAKQATTAKQKANEHYQPWVDTNAVLDGYTGLNSIMFANISSLVVWP